MHPSLLCLLLALPQALAPQVAPASAAAAEPTYLSETRPFRLDAPIELNLSVSGIQIQSVTFKRDKVEPGFFSFTENTRVATRILLKVANTSGRPRRLAFALAVEDKDGRLISAAVSDRKGEKVQNNKVEELELHFPLLDTEASRADHFKLVVEPRAE